MLDNKVEEIRQRLIKQFGTKVNETSTPGKFKIHVGEVKHGDIKAISNLPTEVDVLMKRSGTGITIFITNLNQS